jgi:glycosyltransferase involved in cell wall biosynthesis
MKLDKNMFAHHIYKFHKQVLNKTPDNLIENKSYKLNEKKILMIGMLDSPHFQIWLNNFQNYFPEITVLVFPSDRPRNFTKKLTQEIYSKSRTKIFHIIPNNRLNFFIYYLFDNLYGLRWRSYFLAWMIYFHKPKTCHFHEMQHSAYIFNYIHGHKKIPKNMHKIISTWGSDLNLYGWVDEHQYQLKTCLSWANVVTCERSVEINHLTKFGFAGEIICPLYITLGFKPSTNLKGSKPSTRRKIIVKGYQDNPGRGLNTLAVISELKPYLNDYEILIFSASESVKIQAQILKNRYDININVLEKVKKIELIDLFLKSRLYIGLSISDGMPSSLVEAMDSGCFPIQSMDSAAAELIKHGENGFIVDPWDLKKVETLLTTAILNDELVDQARAISRRSLNENYNFETELLKFLELYK